MRTSIVRALCACLVCGSNLLAQQSLPYTATVTVERATIRSAPRTTAYATAELRRGDTVEVYREDADGWLAIRPPKDCFSLVAQDRVQRTDEDSIGEVKMDGTSSWVGPTLRDVTELISHVSLKRGELVELIGVQQFSQGVDEPPVAYYVIAAPAGEFRWIHRGDVESKTITTVSDTSIRLPGTQLQVAKDLRDGLARPSPRKTAANPLPTAATWRASFQSVAGNVEGIREKRWTPRIADLGNKLDNLNLQLSFMVAQDVASWDLPRLRERAEAVVDAGNSAVQRGRARLVLDRIRQFEDLQKRRLAAGVPDDATSRGKSDLDGLGPVGTGISAADDPDLLDSRYDGHGWLMPLHSAKRRAPPFALLDDNGKIIQFVTPAPGLNLRRYVKKNVGIVGQRGFVQSLNMAHVTAERVIDLDRHRR